MENTDSLAGHARVALDRGHGLFEWWRQKESSGSLRKFSLVPPAENLLEMSAFFDETRLDGQVVPVMGCYQRARFQVASMDGAHLFSRHLEEAFVSRAQWVRRDGSPGGFGYTPLRYKRQGEESVREFEVEPGPASFDLGDLNSRYDWVVLRVDIYDFVRSFPPARPFARVLSRFVKESAYVVAHPEYSAPAGPSPESVVGDYCFGYSFLPCVVEPNLFGFGPGRFQTAVKQFRFLLLDDGSCEVQLIFVVSPRSQKVLYLGGFDPIYGAVHLLDNLTFRSSGIRRAAHDKVDAVMLALHGRVHQNLLLGMRSFWEQTDWAPDLVRPKRPLSSIKSRRN